MHKLPVHYSVVNEAAGIYCALCILLRQLEVEGSVDLVTTVQRLRRQRPGILTAKVRMHSCCLCITNCAS